MKEARSGGNIKRRQNFLKTRKTRRILLLSLLSHLSRPPIMVFVKASLNNLPNFLKFIKLSGTIIKKDARIKE
jgi:hypothetical protein